MDVNGTGTLAGFAASQAFEAKLPGDSSGNIPENRLKEVAREFSSILYLEVLKAMRAASPQEGLEGEQTGREIYNSMMDREMARVMAKHDSSGLAKVVEVSLRKSVYRKAATEPVLPASGVVTSRFGFRRDPFAKSVKFHEGIDIAAAAGAPVKAPVAGRVSFSGKMAGFGNIVEVNHGNGLRTRYAHNSVNLVAKGDYVARSEEHTS